MGAREIFYGEGSKREVGGGGGEVGVRGREAETPVPN